MHTLFSSFKWALVLAMAATTIACAQRHAPAQPRLGQSLSPKILELEKSSGGRIGVHVMDTGTGAVWSYRSKERFPLASTFKAFACANFLDQAAKGLVDPQKRVRFQTSDLETYSPVTQSRVGGDGMSLFEFCDAATSMSDNTAANFILRNTGGPEGLTKFMRSIGDGTTRMDRFEPQLNDVGPGELRDTTTPEAASTSLRKLILGDALSKGAREQLKTWLVANQVGGPLLRLHLPAGWAIADRTGSGDYGSRGVIAVIWPKKGDTLRDGPVVVAIYLTGTQLTLDQRSAMVADIGAALFKDLMP